MIVYFPSFTALLGPSLICPNIEWFLRLWVCFLILGLLRKLQCDKKPHQNKKDKLYFGLDQRRQTKALSWCEYILSCFDELFFFILMVFASDINQILDHFLNVSTALVYFLNNMTLSIKKRTLLCLTSCPSLPSTLWFVTHERVAYLSGLLADGFLVHLTFCRVWNQIKQKGGKCTNSTGSSVE